MKLTQLEQDRAQNAREITYLLTDADRKLRSFQHAIQKNRRHIPANEYEELRQRADIYRKEIARQIIRVKDTGKDEQTIDRTHTEIREYLRTHVLMFAALITSTDWQSPSFTHSLVSQAGRETGSIYATRNDYKRDQHWDAFRYEQAFVKEYVDAWFKLPIHVYATSSGMSAFTTILLFLMGEKKINGPILAGHSIYFENKTLLTELFGDRLIFAEESDANEFVHSVLTHRPSAVFIDSLSNSPEIVVPDISTIIGKLLSRVTRETYLIIDNTGRSIDIQPFSRLFGKRTKLHIIQFESLNKYHQFGMDRTTGGIIVSYGAQTGKLFEYRDHGGTNISDVSAATLPTPNRIMLASRLDRHKRNATLLADTLNRWLKTHPSSPIAGISYPGRGCYMTVGFRENRRNIRCYTKFVTSAITAARRLNVNLTSGTSFGLNTTRVYLTATRSKPYTPFVRIAVGTEHESDMQQVCQAFLHTIEQIR